VRSIAVAAATAAALLWLPPAAPASTTGYGEGDYWRTADRLQERIDDWWASSRGLYKPGDLSSDTQVNANMLLVHSVAALRGQDGPARQDDRARSIAAHMVQAPPFVDMLGRQFGQLHAPGWSGAMTSGIGMQHLVVDAEVAEALAAALRAQRALALQPQLVAAIRDRLYRVAAGPFWRYPAIRLNQINWYAAVYSAATDASGDPSFLRRDLRNQVTRFVHGIRRPLPGRSGNLAGGMRFQYVPGGSPGSDLNFDSPEYANLVASFTRFWGHARRLGMAGLPAADRVLLQRWMRRVLAGYWTHAGYLNWDTGFGFRRLHQNKKVGLAQQGLLAIAMGGELSPGSTWSAWAKRILDRSFALYLRWLPEGKGLPPALLFDVNAHPTTATHVVLGASRVAANAVRAAAVGLGGRPSRRPPPLYAFDPDNGRLAVTTPRYSTAIVPVNNGAFPYGGIDIARLFDGQQEVAANIGGVPPASFGLTVRRPGGRLELATQRPRRRVPVGTRPLRLLRAPSGVGAAPDAPPDRAYAGRFSVLEAAGAVRRAGLSAHTRYRFARDSILAGWTLRADGRRRRTVQIGFPSKRKPGDEPQLTAVLASGARVALSGESRLRLGGVRYFTIDSGGAGYRVVPRDRPRGAIARVVQPRRQSSAPRPGQTLVIELATDRRVRRVAFRARIIPR
jgi:hypothetical protein